MRLVRETSPNYEEREQRTERPRAVAARPCEGHREYSGSWAR
jgi:hypothetical protein